MKKSILLSILLASTLLASCGKTNSDPIKIEFEEFYDKAYLFEEYDMQDVIKVDKDIKYDITATYYDYLKDETKTLDVENTFYFTPVETYDIKVDIKAQKGQRKDHRVVTIPVGVNGDPIDSLLVSDGMSGWADDGIYKTLNTDEVYLKGEDSFTSIHVAYQGANTFVAGATTLCLHNFRCTDLFSVGDDYSNAALRFWVYNPNDYQIEFQLRLKEQNYITPEKDLIDIDWGNFIKVSQYAKQKQWTEIVFSLRHFGVLRKLVETDLQDYKDSFIVKCRYLAPNTTSYYSFDYYVDELDVVQASTIPSLKEEDTRDVSKKETIELGYENCYIDSGWVDQTSIGLGEHAHVNYDSTNIRTTEHQSKSSLHLSFDECVEASGIGYFVAFNLIAQGEEDQKYIKMNKGKLVADFKFKNVSNTNVTVTGVRLYNDEWEFYKKSYSLTSLGDGWLRLEADLTDPTFNLLSNPQRLAFTFDGINDVTKSTAVIYVDNVFFIGQ